MLKNIIKIAYRNLIKQKSYSIINIFGLSLGITCSILIFAYIGYELSYDTYHKNGDNIYRIVSKQVISGKSTESARSPAPVGPTLVEDFPEVINAVRFSPTVKRAFNYEDRHFFQEHVFYADRSVFDVFSFELIKGDPKTALELPFTMVITESTAKKYFGEKNPMGEFINWDNKFDYQVTGVVKDPPPNSHFTFTVLASFSTFIKYDPRIGSWRGGQFPTYLLLRKNSDYKKLEYKIREFNDKYLGSMLKEIGAELDTYLQPLTSIHLRSHLVSELGVNGDIKIIYAFSAIAVVILLIACINFMNLSTARSIRRAKEVGMRKVLGAEKRNLILQFLGESFIYTILSSLLAAGAARLIIPYFKTLSGVELSIGYDHIPIQLAVLAGIVIFTGLAAGSYPAFFLSSIRPITALKSNLPTGTHSSRFRSALVAFQFVLTTILIISTFIIFNQHKYMQDKDLGFNKKDILVIAIQNDEVRSGIESFKNELLTLNGVVSAGTSSMVPGEIYLFNFGVYPEGFVRDQVFLMDNFLVDYSFLDTFEIDVVLGRGFSRQISSDFEEAVMINETAARVFEWSNPIGKTIEIPIDDHMVRKRIIGVFQDIHQRSLYSLVNPTFIQYIGTKGPIENRARRLSLRLEKKDLAATMALIEQKWKKTFPNHPYYSFFLDDFFDSQHRAEANLGSLFRAFSILAVFIAGLGLFGLASFMAEQRTKEIGIRKVLGSPVTSLVMLLCRKFFFLVGVANIIAWPIAFYIMNSWLHNFPYPASIRMNIFIISGVMTLLIAVLSVGHQALRAAQKNPVESLRFE